MSVMVLFGEDLESMMLKEQEISTTRRFEGWDVRSVDARKDEPAIIHEAFDVGLFDENPVLVVLRSASKVKGLAGYLSRDGLDILIIQEGDILKSLEGYPKHEFKGVKNYQKRESAVKFLMMEVKKHGRALSEDIAGAVVKRVGNEYGVLRWEALKFAYSGAGDITAKEALGVIAPLSESEGTGIMDALATRNTREFLRECLRMEQTKPGDQTMALCSGLLTRNVMLWLEICLRDKKGENARDMASELKMNPYVLEKTVLPQARLLGIERLRRLLCLTAECERAVLWGSVSPWAKFKSGVLSIIL